MSKNENVVENEAVKEKNMEAVEFTKADESASEEKVSEPTKEQIIAAYKDLDAKYAKLFRAYANLMDLYLGNTTQGK